MSRFWGRSGFENAYVLAMRRERAAALGVVSIPGLAPHTPQLTLGSDLEFLSRPEWAAPNKRMGSRSGPSARLSYVHVPGLSRTARWT